MIMRPWACLSSSSGETFEALWTALSAEAKAECRLMIVDRDCMAHTVAERLLGKARVMLVDRKKVGPQNFEAEALKLLQATLGPQGLVLLCGFFGILSSAFLESLGLAVVNTHPTLLPSFQGLDRKVHEQASQTVLVSGFTMHLVTEELDGGPILFQHPVFLDPVSSQEAHRQTVRQAEQKYLPLIFEDLLKTDLKFSDRKESGFELRNRLVKQGLRTKSFVSKELST
jgi:phosphoribosylglycinamide formyltransferase 1